jgi:amino acid adenylation domain-containing protein
MSGEAEQKEFQVVVNDEGQFSVWGMERAVPSGWQPVGGPASRDDCLREISKIWSDIRPRRATSVPADSSPATLLDGFRRTVDRYGDRPAVSDDDRQRLTYRELDVRSNVLAAELTARGIEIEDRVALYMERGVDLFVSILGVLKAGAAYVAVDLRYPDRRRDFMVRASGARLVLATPGWGSRIGNLDVAVSEWMSGNPAVETANPAPAVGSESAACVLFTSGSSGTPKAIVLEHRNLASFGYNAALPPLRETDRIGQVSSVSFDAFHFETWCSFARGSEIVILPPFPELLAGDLQRELRRRRVTAMLAPTMAVNHVLHEDRDAFSALRILHTGGDILLPAACRDLLSSSFAGEFFNLYGPSEATTACTVYPVREIAADADTVPIGEPVEGASIYLLDPNLNTVPPGEGGEIHVSGSGVARGYLNDSGLTADRFRPDPYAGGGRRMYATGDMARMRPDGQLEFLGRADDQVKIRGYRVEPRETERALYRHADVRDAVVLVTGPADDRRLVAFVVPYDTVSPRDLRAFADEALPDFMVPSDFITLSAIPGDDHGKRDLAQLSQLLELHQARRDRWVEPDRPHEKYLVSLWEQLLGVEHIGATDDFFQLGGHSLAAFRVQRAVKRDLGVQLKFRDILDNGTLRALAEIIERHTAGAPR